MRLIDRRCGWSVNGDFIAMIPANSCLTNEEMLIYYNLRPDNDRYPALVRPCQFPRVVLRKHNGDLVVAPLNNDVEDIST